MSTTPLPTQRGRPGRNENFSQEASHARSLEAKKEDALKHKAQGQTSRPPFPGPYDAKAGPQVSQEVLAALSETTRALDHPPLFSHDGIFSQRPNPDFLLPPPELASENSQRQAPEHAGGCTGPPANQGDDLPPSLPPPSQPPSQKGHVPKPPIAYDAVTAHRIGELDKDTRTLVKSYGGYPLKNQLVVLEKVEDWQAEHGRRLMDVERKDGKGGVLSVTCNVCLALKPDMPLEEARHKTVQKAAEHIISFHWELSAWSCIRDDCEKVFRRKQECDRHEESHGIVTKKKEKKIASQQAGANTKPPPSNPSRTSVPDTTSHKNRTKRHETAPQPNTLLAPPSTSGGPVRPRSRDPSPNRATPYPIRHTHSAPNLSGMPTRPSSSDVPDVFSGYNEIPTYPPPSMNTMTPAPQLTLTDDSGTYSQLSYNNVTSGVFSPPQSEDIQSVQRYPPHDALAQAYPGTFVPLPQGRRITQIQGPSLQCGTGPTQAQFVPTAAYGPPPRAASYGMQSRQYHQQYPYTQPMNITGTTTATTTHQPGRNPFEANSPPYSSDGSTSWSYPPGY